MPQINRGECMLIIYFLNSEICYNQTHYQKNWVHSIYTMIVTKQLLGKEYTLKRGEGAYHIYI